MPLDRFCNVVEHWHTKHLSEAERRQFDMWMNRPLPGEVIDADDPVWGDDALSVGHGRLQAQMSGGPG